MKPLALAAAAIAFAILATANSGGYRYGVSDQAFYVPAVAKAADASLFPRDSALLAPQMRLWAGDTVLAAVQRTLGVSQPQVFAAAYVIGLCVLFGAAVGFARGLGASWWAVTAATALLTIRHRIPRTGANSLEGYMHPRMIAFALGLSALALLLRRRLGLAVVLIAIAWVAHPTTAFWFAVVAGFGHLVRAERGAVGFTAMTRGALALLVVVGAFAIASLVAGQRMSDQWVSVLDEKDYLFPHRWPLYAWVLNLLYPLVILAIHSRRRSLGLSSPGETAVVAGLLALVAGFALTVPLVAGRYVTFVQIQTNRVFWLLDATALLYVCWWLVDDVAARRRWQAAVAVVLIVLAAARGAYSLRSNGRSFARLDLVESDWTDTMRWVRAQPSSWQVLAAPGHAWRYGSSVRTASLHDTVLEESKDAAMSLYDELLAMRVAERSGALRDFDNLSEGQYRELAAKYDARILVLERVRTLDLPKLFENQRFVVYDLK